MTDLPAHATDWPARPSPQLANRTGLPARSAGFQARSADMRSRFSHFPSCSAPLLLAVWCLFTLTLTAQSQSYQNWGPFVRHLNDTQRRTPLLRQVAHTVIAYQTPIGGWPKNIFYPNPTAEDSRHLAAVRQEGTEATNHEATIDNGATTTEIRFLLHMAKANCPAVQEKHRQDKQQGYQPDYQPDYQSDGQTDGQTESPSGNQHVATFIDSLCTAALHGIEYLLCMQYSNGGYPQYWPRNDHYHAHITFNDNAMTNALRLLIDFAAARSPFDVLDTIGTHQITVALMRQRALKACVRGVQCILDCQLRDSTGTPAIWCQQHHPVTLAAIGARAYELPSFCTSESIDILRFLRQCQQEPLLQDNTLFTAEELANAIGHAEQWLEAHALTGIRKEFYQNEHRQRDFRMVPCLPEEHCPRLWARFYDLRTERPMFVDRDGIPQSRIEHIGWERRNGYAWFNADFDKYLSEQTRRQ